MFNSAVCRCAPDWPLYETSTTVELLSCRWMERFQLLYSGSRVASLPCHQGIASPFDPEGLTNGGRGKEGKLPLRRNAGVTPLSWVLKPGLVENPWLWVDPVTVVTTAKERAYEVRITVLGVRL